MDRCQVSVGEASTVVCHDYSRCDVECRGTCQVSCASPDGCSVTCAGGLAPSECRDGSFACGPC
jgi:hypothetical protein